MSEDKRLKVMVACSGICIDHKEYSMGDVVAVKSKNDALYLIGCGRCVDPETKAAERVKKAATKLKAKLKTSGEKVKQAADYEVEEQRNADLKAQLLELENKELEQKLKDKKADAKAADAAAKANNTSN